MNHYCTYFDSGFAIQGLALWRSLAAHDREAVLWVLALDDKLVDASLRLNEPRLRVVPLTELEAGDTALAAAKATRSRVEYFFTLSPCWPRWLLATQPEIARLAYLDADLFFFADPTRIFAALDAAGASVLMTAHRFAPWLKHYEQHGRYNVGVEVFRNDEAGRDWCFDRLEGERYADQKYLDAWPRRFGSTVFELPHPGVNLAPWNWASHRVGVTADHRVTVDEQPLIVFHFARFRPIVGTWWWHSGHLDYGVMPWRVRQTIYGPYWRALDQARATWSAAGVALDFPHRPPRFGRSFWRGLPLRLLFGSDWLRVGGYFVSGRLGLGRWSGRFLAALRARFRIN
jgi:hypothetical protein